MPAVETSSGKKDKRKWISRRAGSSTMGDVIQRRKDVDPQSSPFYALPAARKTSAEIIREARAAIGDDRSGDIGVGIARIGVKTFNTKRPFTPQEKKRTLFGPVAAREERPPSSFTLSPLHFDASDANTRSGGTACENGFKGKLLPLLSISSNTLETLPISIGHKKLNKFHFRNAHSLCDLPEEDDAILTTKLYTKAGHPESIIMSAAFQKMSQEKDLKVTDIDANAENNNVRYLSIGNRDAFEQRTQPSTPEIPQVNLSKEDMLPMSNSGAVSTLLTQHGDDMKKFVSKRKNGDLPAQHEEIRKISASQPPAMVGNGYQETARDQVKKHTTDQALFFEEKISPLLDEINRALICGLGDSAISELVQKLYNTLDNCGMLGRHFRYRSNVLKVIFKLVDREHGTLLANVARTMLAMKVSGNNLTSVCKLIFKVTRHDTNDALFMEGNLLELLLDAVACSAPLEIPEACVYGYGALKFLTMNSQLVSRLLNRGILELLVLHMKLIISEKEEKGSIPEQTGYALVQLAATLRHVSSCDKAFPLLLGTGAVHQVCKLLNYFYDDTEVTANVVRVLSIMSTQDDCCIAAAKFPETLQAAVRALRVHSHHPAIVVRLAYAMGNMMACTDESRWELFNVKGFSETAFDLLRMYIRKDREEQADSFVEQTSKGSSEDVIVKLIRILANISVHPEVGAVLSCSDTCLNILVSIVRHKSIEESEELLLSALATLNNLTFYTRLQTPSNLHLELAECLCETLPMEHLEGLIEAIRVFGNLTHAQKVRDIIVKKEVLEILIELLDCDSRELVFVCAGVLVNMMRDAKHRSTFQEKNGVSRMNDVLQYFGYGDWQLCSLCCQVLWNYRASANGEAIDDEEKGTGSLINILEEFLDDDSYFNNPDVPSNLDSNVNEVAHSLWEDFASVATELLEIL